MEKRILPQKWKKNYNWRCKHEKNNGEYQNKIEKIFQDILIFIDQGISFMTQMDLDELADVYEKKVDEVILDLEKMRNLKYVGGKFIITYVSAEIFSLRMELYFLNKDNKWEKSESITSKYMKYLKPRAVEELEEKKKIIYDIESPKEQMKKNEE